MNQLLSYSALFPPILAILIAVWRKNALLALALGLLSSHLLLSIETPVETFYSLSNGLLKVFQSPSNLYVFGFSLLIGASVGVIQHSGAVGGLTQWLANKKLVTDQRSASFVPTFMGVAIFTDSNLSLFSGGMASQSLFDRYKMSRLRLAFLLDATCAPVAMLVLINGWGAFVVSLLHAQGVASPSSVLVNTLLYNFYCWIVLGMAFYTAWTTRTFGLLKRFEQQNTVNPAQVNAMPETTEQDTGKARFLVVPLGLIVVGSFICMWITGNGVLRDGDGAFSVFVAVSLAFVTLITMRLLEKNVGVTTLARNSAEGAKALLPIILILVLSIAFGQSVRALGAGELISQLVSDTLPTFVLLPLIFIVSGLMAFTTGTSWGTFATMIPLTLPVTQALGLPPEVCVAAVLSGGIFGDHASPISDTTIVASLASGCDHIEHVETQLPYAFVAALISIVGFMIVGYM